ncbi:hypothetical protein AB1Y20_006086 [Prymnesium parvum]|uniref:Nucleotide-diphospho-sugar transferase domain-containing protein n=1 Tax=Prymnesium parvum TaxID=97485 RepID=A0AB34J1P6_PRYPA
MSPGGFADGRDVHVALTSSCDRFQYWQTEVALHSALRSGHRGPITRIVVGCEQPAAHARRDATTHLAGALDETVPPRGWTTSSHPNATTHFVPATPLGTRFPWFNKAWGFRHWAEHSAPRAPAVALLDPDQFFLAPLTQGVLPPASWQLVGPWAAGEATDTPRAGVAIAQKYGLGARWLQMFDREKICGAGTWCTRVTVPEALKHFSIGTPYVVHASDLKRLMETWWAFMPGAYQQDRGDIQVDMYAYNMAAAHLGVRHVTMQHYMVSSPAAADEGWKEVDALKNISCDGAGLHAPGGSAWSTPTVTHACQTYVAYASGAIPRQGGALPGEEPWFFHKGHVPPRILDCDHPLLQRPPDDLFNVQTTVVSRRRAFMVCALHRQINEGLAAYKKKYCDAQLLNLRECVRLTRSGTGSAEFPGRFAKRVC